MNQFRDFYTFCKRIQSSGMKTGIVKVIPPDEWLEKQPEISEAPKKIKIANPIRQKPEINEPGVLLQQAIFTAPMFKSPYSTRVSRSGTLPSSTQF
ncbi:hypothetical protein CF319_g9547 [Tilletia indica]|nr:hypothetical protein CF319_g9547 [Tilletia indica]